MTFSKIFKAVEHFENLKKTLSFVCSQKFLESAENGPGKFLKVLEFHVELTVSFRCCCFPSLLFFSNLFSLSLYHPKTNRSISLFVFSCFQVKLYNEKRSDLEEQQLHLNVGLQKIRETVDQVCE